MITEIAILQIRKQESNLFQEAFAIAQSLLSSMKGYLGHELQKSIEKENKYLLIVRWQTLEAHTEGFRKSEAYAEWKKMLHHFYDPFPVVEHYKKIY
jgi:heme-degrading monooxygenase HmoA